MAINTHLPLIICMQTGNVYITQKMSVTLINKAYNKAGKHHNIEKEKL